MVLHIGRGNTVKEKEIIGIFDLDNASITAVGRAFLSRASKEKRVKYADDDIPRSFIVTEDGGVILSSHTSAALRTRAEQGIFAEE